MLDIINTRWFAAEIGFSRRRWRWCFIAYGPKHDIRTKTGRTRWEWTIEYAGGFRFYRYWLPYQPDGAPVGPVR